MVKDVFVFLEQAFLAAVQFCGDIIASVGGEDFIIFAVSIVLTVSLLFLPLRGSSVPFRDYKAGKTSKTSKEGKK